MILTMKKDSFFVSVSQSHLYAVYVKNASRSATVDNLQL